MNRRISRIALLVVLLLSMVGAFQTGGEAKSYLAQTPENCGNYRPYDPELDTDGLDIILSEIGTPVNDEAYQVNSVYQTPIDDQNEDKLILLDVTLFPDREVTLLSGGNSLLRIDSGGVTLVNCNPEGDNSSIFVQLPGQEEMTEVRQGELKFAPVGSAIFVQPKDTYYLWDGDHEGESVQVGGIKQLSNDLSVDSLSNLAGSGSRITSSSTKSSKLCGGAGC